MINSQNPTGTATGSVNPTQTGVDTEESTGTGINGENPANTGNNSGASTGAETARQPPTDTAVNSQGSTETRVQTGNPTVTGETSGAPPDTATGSEAPTNTAENTKNPTDTAVASKDPSNTTEATNSQTEKSQATEQPTETSVATAEQQDTSAATEGQDTSTASEEPTEAPQSTGEPTGTTEASQDLPATTKEPDETADRTTAAEPETTKDQAETTGGKPETSPASHVPPRTTEPPKKTSDDTNEPTKSPEPTEASEIEEVVTGTDGAVVTYTPTKDPEHSDLTETLTTTDDGGAVVIIFPGGWKWSPKGNAPTNRPPAPTKEPENDDKEDEDEDEEEDPTSTKPTSTSAECTASEPPECTKTVSFDWVGDDYSTTTFGDCPATSACVTGEQSTTTTYAIETVPLDERFGPLEEADESKDSSDPDKDTNDWFEDWYDEAGFELALNLVSPECGGDRTGIDFTCFVGLFPTFCTEVNKNKKDELSRELTSDDKFSAGEKRSLWPSWFAKRQDKCGGYKYTFEWTGEDGKNDCLEDCIGAFGQVSAVCALAGEDGIYAEGEVDVGCGKYSYWIEEEEADPEPTTTQKEKQEPTESATPLESSEPVCNDAADFPGHADIHKSSVESTAQILCLRHPLIPDGEYTDDESKELGFWDEIQKDVDNVNFRYSLYWIEGCVLEGDNTQSPYRPTGSDGDPCPKVFFNVWDGCKSTDGCSVNSNDANCSQARATRGLEDTWTLAVLDIGSMPELEMRTRCVAGEPSRNF